MPSTLPGRSVLVVLLCVVLSALPLHGTGAHSALIGSTPGSGSRISAMPAEIELRFDEELRDVAPALILRRDSKTVAELEPRVVGGVMAADPPSYVLPDGSYQLAWRVVSQDGHPLSGSIVFRIGDVQPPATKAPLKAPSPTQASTSKPSLIVLGFIPVAVFAALLLRRRLIHADKKEKQS